MRPSSKRSMPEAAASRRARKRDKIASSCSAFIRDSCDKSGAEPSAILRAIGIIREVVMSDLEAFRRDTRAWLEKNCPAAMRGPMSDAADVCWGGRSWKFKNEDQRLWLERMLERGWTA